MVEKTQRPSKLWRTVLVCSLALNLAVAGVVGGSLATGRFADGPPRNFDLGLGPVARALAPQERRAITRDLRADRGLRGMDLRGRADAMVVILKSDPFDAAALHALLLAQSEQVATLQARARDAFLATVADMTPERRSAYADQLRKSCPSCARAGRAPIQAADVLTDT